MLCGVGGGKWETAELLSFVVHYFQKGPIFSPKCGILSHLQYKCPRQHNNQFLVVGAETTMNLMTGKSFSHFFEVIIFSWAAL